MVVAPRTAFALAVLVVCRTTFVVAGRQMSFAVAVCPVVAQDLEEAVSHRQLSAWVLPASGDRIAAGCKALEAQ